jgi:hypothetical protein
MHVAFCLQVTKNDNMVFHFRGSTPAARPNLDSTSSWKTVIPPAEPFTHVFVSPSSSNSFETLQGSTSDLKNPALTADLRALLFYLQAQIATQGLRGHWLKH